MALKSLLALPGSFVSSGIPTGWELQLPWRPLIVALNHGVRGQRLVRIPYFPYAGHRYICRQATTTVTLSCHSEAIIGNYASLPSHSLLGFLLLGNVGGTLLAGWLAD